MSSIPGCSTNGWMIREPAEPSRHVSLWESPDSGLLDEPVPTAFDESEWEWKEADPGENGCVVADQLRTVDKVRMVRRLGGLSPATITQVLDLLQRMFAP